MQTPRRRFWIGFGLLTICLFIFPINNLPLRVATVFMGLAAYGGIIYFFRRRKMIFNGLILIPVSIGIFLACPGKTTEPQKLRPAYLESLRTYVGTRYIWGGENRLGIDCSGLIRAGFIKANFEQGLQTLNPKLVRFAMSLWWHDCSAKALGEEYRGLTRKIISSTGINSLDGTQILPGDMAVTTSGVHVLVFLGGDEWIEADPTLGKVVVVIVPSKDNPWFNEPVQIMRWTELEAK